MVNKSRKVWQKINGIKDKNGKILCETNTILDEFAGYFKHLGIYNESG